MNRSQHCQVLLISTVVFWLGCSGPIGNTSQSAATSYEEYVGEQTDAELKGWTELGMVFDSTNNVVAKISPKEPKAGQPIKVELHFYSEIRKVQNIIWTRIGKNPVGEIENPEEGNDWMRMEMTGGLIWSSTKNRMVDVSETIATQERQPGKSFYEANLVVPTGKSFVEFKIEHQTKDDVAYFSVIEINAEGLFQPNFDQKEKGSDESEDEKPKNPFGNIEWNKPSGG